VALWLDEEAWKEEGSLNQSSTVEAVRFWDRESGDWREELLESDL